MSKRFLAEIFFLRHVFALVCNFTEYFKINGYNRIIPWMVLARYVILVRNLGF